MSDTTQTSITSERMTSPEDLRAQLEPIHDVAQGMVLSTLLPAIHIAWADGQIQRQERELILRLAEEHGLGEDPTAMARIASWLAIPPSLEDVHAALAGLRGEGTSDGEAAERALAWAHAVARAEGGFLGLGAINHDERRALATLAAALEVEPPEHPLRTRRPTNLGAALEVMRDLLSDRLRSVTKHVDLVPRDAQTMWPQPSPWGADRMPPAVLGVPEWEYREFMTRIIPRYVRSLKQGWWDAVEKADRPGVAEMDDEELARLVYRTPFSRFLSPLGADDDARFAPQLAKAAGAIVYKIDHAHLASWTPIAGMHVAPTVGLFALEGDVLRPLAIAVGDAVFVPGPTESWHRARYFLLQGCSLALVVGIHPFLHFPMDTVIGVTREVLAREHPVARLVEPHAYLHLPLNYGVLWNPRSVAHNHQHEIYAPLPAPRDDIFRGVSDHYRGMPGNPAYPGFRYPMEAPSFPGEYCAFLASYYEVVLKHCRRVVAVVSPKSESMRRWAETLHAQLPGFPTPSACEDPDVLARALAGFIHSVSIWHSAEHHAYAQEPVTKVPQRLRVPPPRGDDPVVPTRQWMRRVDIARQELARQMFYEAHTLRAIVDVEYGFVEPELADAARTFVAELRACDAQQKHRYIELDRIAQSLQF